LNIITYQLLLLLICLFDL